MGTRAMALGLLFLGGALAAPAAARPAAEGDFLSALEDPTLDAAAFAHAASSALVEARSSPVTLESRGLSYCSRDDDAAARAELGRLRAGIDRAVAALKAVGIELRGEEAPLLVLRVRVPEAPPLVADLGSALAVRVDTGRRFVAPDGTAKAETWPQLREVFAAAARARATLAAGRRAASGASDTLERALAARIAARAPSFEAQPGWLRDGMVSWLAEEVRDPAAPPPPPHLRALPAGPPDAAGAVVVKDPPDPAWGAARAALVRRLAANGKLAIVLGAGGGATAEVLGASPAALAAEAVAAMGTPTCDAAGTVACLACNGKNPLEIHCDNCDGTRSLGCTACHAWDDCPAPGCYRGQQTFEGGKTLRCRYCAAGKTKCMACGGKFSVPCKACGGPGKRKIPCPACTGGRTPCPSCPGPAPGDRCPTCKGEGGKPCVWTAPGSRGIPCRTCLGAAVVGCSGCDGTLRILCDGCGGTGEVRMVYADGTTASATKCGQCGGRGFGGCDCEQGKRKCGGCKATGLVPHDPAQCGACAGLSRHPCAGCGEPAPAADAGGGPTDAQMRKLAELFVLTCRAGDGRFCTREASAGAFAGEREKPTLFATASALWALTVVGRDAEDPELQASWSALRSSVDAFLERKGWDAATPQSAAFALRALLVARRPQDEPRARGLVQVLLQCQRPDGFWDDHLDRQGVTPDKELNELTTLIVVEALRVASDRGIPVPQAALRKTLATATASFEQRAPGSMKAGRLSATEVASKTALVVLAKAATLGEERRTFDYTSIPCVRFGLEWLDRYGTTGANVWYTGGGRARQMDGQGYFAWLFSLQRLAMLLRVDEVGGENWYRSGLRHLRGLQRKDGSFEERGKFAANDSFWSTISAMLFLARATTPISGDGAK